MVSVIGSFYTLSNCIDIVNGRSWVGINAQQKKYLGIYKNCKGANLPEITSNVSGNAKDANAFLASKGFDIELKPMGRDDVAITSILHLILKWLNKGIKTKVRYLNESYEAVNLDSGVSVVYIPGFKQPVASIITKNGDEVLMTMLGSERPRNSFDTFDLARKLVFGTKTFASGYERRVIFPMIHLDTKPDISWLLGFRSGIKTITQALQQTKVDMDEVGVVIKEAVSIVMTLSCAMPQRRPLYIDEPFLFAVKRKGLKEPLFSAYLDIDSWIKKPQTYPLPNSQYAFRTLGG